MEGFVPSDYEEIVYELAVIEQRLGANPGLARYQVVRLNLRNELPETSDKSCLAEGAIYLLHPFTKMLASELPKTEVRHGLAKVAQVEIGLLVALSLKRQDRIGPSVHRAVDHLCKVHPQERKVGIRDRIDQRPYEMSFARSQFVVFTAKRNDFCARFCTGQARHTVTVETGAA